MERFKNASCETDMANGNMICWETLSGSGLGTGVYISPNQIASFQSITPQQSAGGYQALITQPIQGNLTYHVGFGWEKANEITSTTLWKQHLVNFKEKTQSPLTISAPVLCSGNSCGTPIHSGETTNGISSYIEIRNGRVLLDYDRAPQNWKVIDFFGKKILDQNSSLIEINNPLKTGIYFLILKHKKEIFFVSKS